MWRKPPPEPEMVLTEKSANDLLRRDPCPHCSRYHAGSGCRRVARIRTTAGGDMDVWYRRDGEWDESGSVRPEDAAAVVEAAEAARRERGGV